jgi:hypothetical protein
MDAANLENGIGQLASQGHALNPFEAKTKKEPCTHIERWATTATQLLLRVWSDMPVTVSQNPN